MLDFLTGGVTIDDGPKIGMDWMGRGVMGTRGGRRKENVRGVVGRGTYALLSLRNLFREGGGRGLKRRKNVLMGSALCGQPLEKARIFKY